MTIKEKTPSPSLVNEKIKSFQKAINQKIQEKIDLFPPAGRLKEACEYALLTKGKRFRPALVFMVAQALQKGFDVTSAALATEYFHTASLIADDLPCMDNDDERRNQPTVHKIYGETVAVLASYALIAEGYSAIADAGKSFDADPTKGAMRVMIALENVAFNAGLSGAAGGQFLDLFPPDQREETLREMVHKKTTALFEISFMLGWLFGGGDLDKLPHVKKCASHFGMAFQVADDLDDIDQDLENGSNLAVVLGKETAKNIFFEETKLYRTLLQELQIDSPDLLGLAVALESNVDL